MQSDLLKETNELLADENLDYETRKILRKVKLQEIGKVHLKRKDIVVGEIIYRSMDMEDKRLLVTLQECIYTDNGNKIGKQKHFGHIECDNLTELYSMLNAACVGFYAAYDMEAKKIISILTDLDAFEVGEIDV